MNSNENNFFTPELVLSISFYIKELFNIFGIEFSFFTKEKQTIELFQLNHSIIDSFVQFRNNVRNIAKKSDNEIKKQLFSLCDDIRDNLFHPLGIELRVIIYIYII